MVIPIFQQLINNLDRDLQYAIRVEGKMDVELVSNYEEVKNAILEKVLLLSVVKFKTNNYADAFFCVEEIV